MEKFRKYLKQPARTDGEVAERFRSIAQADSRIISRLSLVCEFHSHLIRFHESQIGGRGFQRRLCVSYREFTNGGAVCFARFSRPQRDEAVLARPLSEMPRTRAAVPDIRFR